MAEKKSWTKTISHQYQIKEAIPNEIVLKLFR